MQRKWNIFLSDKLPLRFYFFREKFTLYRIKLPSKLYHSPLYQFCFRLEHHLVAKFPSILFSCQILISFLRSSCPLFISPQFGVFLICGLPEVTSRVKVWHFLLVFWLWLCKHITKQRKVESGPSGLTELEHGPFPALRSPGSQTFELRLRNTTGSPGSPSSSQTVDRGTRRHP